MCGYSGNYQVQGLLPKCCEALMIYFGETWHATNKIQKVSLGFSRYVIQYLINAYKCLPYNLQAIEGFEEECATRLLNDSAPENCSSRQTSWTSWFTWPLQNQYYHAGYGSQGFLHHSSFIIIVWYQTSIVKQLIFSVDSSQGLVLRAGVGPNVYSMQFCRIQLFYAFRTGHFSRWGSHACILACSWPHGISFSRLGTWISTAKEARISCVSKFWTSKTAWKRWVWAGN